MTTVSPPPAFLRRHACAWPNLLQAFACELPDGRAVSWKEPAGDTRNTHYVPVKSARGIALTKRETIWYSPHWN
ncbi:MAG TPA: hypothetical protein VI140_05330 [Oxalicibacterium sp.]